MNISGELQGMTEVMTSQQDGIVTQTPEERPSLPVWMRAVFSILLSLIIVVSACGNSLVCVLVYQKPIMRSAINLLLAGLACCDVLMSLLLMPPALTVLAGSWSLPAALCQTLGFLHTAITSQATFILLSITMDRYLIICHRFDKLNPYKAKLILTGVTLSSLTLAAPPLWHWAQYACLPLWMQPALAMLQAHRTASIIYIFIYALIIYFLPALLMMFCFLCISSRIRKNLCKVQIGPIEPPAYHISHIAVAVSVSPVTVDMTFKTRTFKTVFMLYCVHSLCFLPYAMCLFAWNLLSDLDHPITANTLILLSFLKSALNPVIFCLRIRRFRDAWEDLMPLSLHLLPKFPHRTKRRINPSSVYEYYSNKSDP